MTKTAKPDLIFVAQVSAANGLQGEFKLLSFMDDPFSVLEYNPLLNERGEPALVITKAREHKGTLIVKAEGVPDRTAADKIKGLKLYIDRAELPEAEEGEYYISDLIGMKAFDAAGNEVGRVMNVDNFGAGDLLDIKPLEGPSFYLLFTDENVPEVHLAERRIMVDLTGI
jgi:16S rRNA processing protein RimM